MGILQKLKSALGMGTSGRSRQDAEPDVTVERKPSAESERAVKTEDPTGGEDDPESVPADDGPPAEPDDEDGPGGDATGEASADDGPDEDATAEASADDEPAQDDSDDEPAEEGATDPDDDSPPVEAITGIGATYADRLEAAGIETVADLADSDVPTVVEAAQATESRVEDWLEQARDW